MSSFDKIFITQSNYIPWKGYFDSIALTDVFVVYDDMQYTKRDWRNRNKIKTPNGLKWLTIPVEVSGKYFQKIKETKVADSSWAVSHLNIIKENYRGAPFYLEVIDWLEPLYLNCDFQFLTDINCHFIVEICNYLQIPLNLKFSSQFTMEEERTERLISICQQLNGKKYYSGPAAKDYLDTRKFNETEISVEFFDYSGYKQYNQLFPPFEHGVSIIDLIFNNGKNSREFLKLSDLPS